MSRDRSLDSEAEPGAVAKVAIPEQPPAAIPPGLALAAAVGNRGMTRLARRILSRDDEYGGTLPPGGAPPQAVVVPAPPPVAANPTPAPAPAPPDRDTVVSGAIQRALSAYENLTVSVPATKPPDPGTRGGGAPAGASSQAVSFATPYFINLAHGDTGDTGGLHALGGRGVSDWWQTLPDSARTGKGSAAQLQAAMQDAVNRGLLNGTWPPTPESLRAFMRTVGLGVDCSGFVHEALKAANAALTAAGLPGLSMPTQTGSQGLGAVGGTRVTKPGDLRAGDIIQLAPHGDSHVGHVRIIIAIRAAPPYVEYDAAESTTRVGSGPQLSTWRVPAGSDLDTAHLEVHNDAAGTWETGPQNRPASYWHRPEAAAATPAATATPALARVLARSAGPGIRSPRALQRAPLATSAPRAGGWNADDRDLTSTWRIEVTGLSQGLDSDDANAATAESAAHRAVVIVPKSVSGTNLEVLVHFHGNNLGQRERTAVSTSAMAIGTVRDVEGDLIPQQVAASGRNLIAILPQGTVAGGSLSKKFGITNLSSYISDVLAQVVTHVNKLDASKNLTALTPVRIEISGHSGGGPSAVESATALQPAGTVTDDQWVTAPPLLLFDAINGPGELNTLTTLVLAWLEADKKRLLSMSEADALALLKRRGLKLRSTYTSGVYQVTNSKSPPRTYEYKPNPPVTIPAELSLEGKLDAWFSKNSAALGTTLAPVLRLQYVVEHWAGSHDYTVGTGFAQPLSDPRTSVPGVTTAPATSAGGGRPAVTAAPAGTNAAPNAAQGNLAKALSLLSPAGKLLPAPPPAAANGGGGSTVAPAPVVTVPPKDDDDLDAGTGAGDLGGALRPGGAR